MMSDLTANTYISCGIHGHEVSLQNSISYLLSKSTSAAEAPTISFIHKYMNILDIHIPLQRRTHIKSLCHNHAMLVISTSLVPTSCQFHKGYTEFSFFEPPLSLDKLAIIPLLFALGAAASEPCAPSMPMAISSMRRRVASSCKRFSSNEQTRKIEI